MSMMNHTSFRIFFLEGSEEDYHLISDLSKSDKPRPFEWCYSSNVSTALNEITPQNCDLILFNISHQGQVALEKFRVLHQALPEVSIVLFSENHNDPMISLILKEGADDVIYQDEISRPLVKKSLYYAIDSKRRKGQLGRFLYTLEQLPVAIIISDEMGDIEYVNAVFTEMTGYTKIEVIGESLDALIGANMGSPYFKRIQDMIQSRRYEKKEIRYTHRNGCELWIELTVSPILNVEGVLTHFVAILEDISPIKIEEEELKKSEDTYRTLVHNINEYIYSVTYDKGVAMATYHSPKCREVTGYHQEEFEADPNLWFSMIHNKDQKRVNSFIEKIIYRKTSDTIEHRIIHKDGTVKWVSNTCAVQINEAGDICKLHGFILDISERRQSEEELRKLSRAVEQSPASVVITDCSGRIEYVNPKFTHLTGYTLAEVLNQNTRILNSGYHSKDFYADLWNTITKGHEWKGELRNRKKNGDYYWEQASISPLKNKKGIITHYIAVKEDITEKKLVEEALRKRNEIMEKDLKLAQLIQKTLLSTKMPEMDFLNVDYRFHPLDKIGGDYYSLLPLDDRTLSVFIGDVSGHGVSAALFLSLVKSATDRICRIYGYNPDEYITHLNKLLVEEMPSYFVTAIYGLFQVNGENDQVVYSFSNGGHPYPILYRADEDSFSLLKNNGTIIGMFDDQRYQTSKIKLTKGDRVFLMTDGIPEVENEEKEIIGFDDGLIALFKRSHREGLKETLDAVIEEVKHFGQEPKIDDDIILMGFEVKMV